MADMISETTSKHRGFMALVPPQNLEGLYHPQDGPITWQGPNRVQASIQPKGSTGQFPSQEYTDAALAQAAARGEDIQDADVVLQVAQDAKLQDEQETILQQERLVNYGKDLRS